MYTRRFYRVRYNPYRSRRWSNRRRGGRRRYF